MAKCKTIERFFARLLDYRRSYLHLRRRRNEISEMFLNKRSKLAFKKTILRDLVPNCGPLAGVGGGRIPLISPPAYAHETDNHDTPVKSVQGSAGGGFCLVVDFSDNSGFGS